MAPFTVYLDPETEALVNQCAKASGLSKSRWVTQVIKRHVRDAWPEQCLALAGAFPDFPLREDCDPGYPEHQGVSKDR